MIRRPSSAGAPRLSRSGVIATSRSRSPSDFSPAGDLGEVFISTGKTGADLQNIAHDAAVTISLAPQHGFASKPSGMR